MLHYVFFLRFLSIIVHRQNAMHLVESQNYTEGPIGTTMDHVSFHPF